MASSVLWSTMPKVNRRLLAAALLLAAIISTGKADNPVSKELQTKSGESETFRVGNEHAAMRKAVDQARKTVGEFIKALQHPAAGQSDFEVKKPFVEGNDVEHIWLSDIEFTGGRFKGKVDNAPIKLHGLKIGQVVSVNPDEISDWAYVDNGKLVGGYTIRAHYNELTPAQKKEFLREADFKLE
jgi:uncharacterized protein YegJ (DUF2314 family)